MSAMRNHVHILTVEPFSAGQATDFVAVCSCGWESLPMVTRHAALSQKCAVMEEELTASKRRARRLGRLAIA